ISHQSFLGLKGIGESAVIKSGLVSPDVSLKFSFLKLVIISLHNLYSTLWSSVGFALTRKYANSSKFINQKGMNKGLAASLILNTLASGNAEAYSPWGSTNTTLEPS